MHLAKKAIFQPSKTFAVTPQIRKLSILKVGERKVNTLYAQPYVIPEVGKTLKSDIRMERTSTHKYNMRSIIYRVNHVTTFKNAPKCFQEDTAGK